MTSPILAFKDAIARAAFQIAPEKSKDLESEVDLSTLTLEFTSDPKFSIEVFLVSKVVKLPVPALEYLWCCAHAFWVFYQVAHEAQVNNTSQVNQTSDPRSCTAVDLLNWSRQNMERPEGSPWPDRMPKPDAKCEYAGDIHVANELFLCAIAWVIHHEIAHICLSHGNFLASSDVQLEKDADNRATEWIISQSFIELETQKRHLGMITALLAIQYLDRPNGTDTYVDSHPPAVERIHYSLDRAGISDDGVVCAFTATALQFHLAQFGIQAPLDGKSFRDILSGFLAAFATHNRERKVIVGSINERVQTDLMQNEFEEHTSQTEIIEVEDKEGGIHYFQVETSIKSSRCSKDQKTIWHREKISCSVHYVFGPKHARIGEHVTTMGGEFSHNSQLVRITNGQVMIQPDNLRGMGLGTYLMNKIVAWAKQFNSTVRVRVVNLSAVDAGPNNRVRRNTLYENFGLCFNYREEDGVEKASGASLAELTIADLICYQHLDGFKTRTPSAALDALGGYVGRLHENNINLHSRLRNANRDLFKLRHKSFANRVSELLNWVLYFVFFVFGLFCGAVAVVGTKEIFSLIRRLS